MGNCCKPASSMEWGGEDWGYLKQKNTRNTRRTSSNKVFDEGQGLSLGNREKEKLFGLLRATADENGKVKIRISKKELAKLVGERSGGVEKQHEEQTKKQRGRASAEQVLLRLAKAHANNHHDDDDDDDDAHHRPWKPELESIPEVN